MLVLVQMLAWLGAVLVRVQMLAWLGAVLVHALSPVMYAYVEKNDALLIARMHVGRARVCASCVRGPPTCVRGKECSRLSRYAVNAAHR